MDEAVEAASLLDPLLAPERAADRHARHAGRRPRRPRADAAGAGLPAPGARVRHGRGRGPRIARARTTATPTCSSPSTATCLGELCAELGEGLLDDGVPESAAPYFAEARQFAEEALALLPPESPGVVTAQIVHGWALVGLGEHAAAVGQLRAAVRITSATADRAQLASARLALGRALRRQGDGAAADEHLVAALTLATEHGLPRLRRAALRELCTLHAELDDAGSALPYLQAYLVRRAGPGRRAAHPLGRAVRPPQEPAGDRAGRRSAAPAGLRGPAHPPAQPPLRRGPPRRPAVGRGRPGAGRRRRGPVQVDQRRDRAPRRGRRPAHGRRTARGRRPRRRRGVPLGRRRVRHPAARHHRRAGRAGAGAHPPLGRQARLVRPRPGLPGHDQRRHRLGRPRRRPAHPVRRRRRRALRRQAQRPRPRRAAVRRDADARRREPAGRAVRPAAGGRRAGCRRRRHGPRRLPGGRRTRRLLSRPCSLPRWTTAPADAGGFAPLLVEPRRRSTRPARPRRPAPSRCSARCPSPAGATGRARRCRSRRPPRRSSPRSSGAPAAPPSRSWRWSARPAASTPTGPRWCCARPAETLVALAGEHDAYTTMDAAAMAAAVGPVPEPAAGSAC